MVLSVRFDENKGALRTENRALPPASYGSARAIVLSPEEASGLATALVAFSEGRPAAQTPTR